MGEHITDMIRRIESRGEQPELVGEYRKLVAYIEKLYSDRQFLAGAAKRHLAEIGRLQAAGEAMVRWFDAEDQTLGSFHDRMDLCKYAEWAARRALGEDVGEFEGVPRLIISTNGEAAQAAERANE